MIRPAAEDDGQIAVTAWAGHRDPVVVTLSGNLDIVSAPVLREELLRLHRLGTTELVIDLSAVQYADASGLAVLVGSQHRATLLGGTLRLAAPRPQVADVLAATGIGKHLDVYPTIQAAIAGWGPGGGTAQAGDVQAVAAALVLPAQSRAEPAVAEPAAVVPPPGVARRAERPWS